MKRNIIHLGMLALGATVIYGLTLVPVKAGGQKSDSEVKVAVQATKPDAAGKQTVTIDLEINKGWHIYSNPVGNDDLASAQTVITVKGKNATAKVVYPKGTLKMDKVVGNYVIYEGKVAIQAQVERAAGDTEPLEVTIRFQACNDKGSCLFPATLKKMVP